MERRNYRSNQRVVQEKDIQKNKNYRAKHKHDTVFMEPSIIKKNN